MIPLAKNIKRYFSLKEVIVVLLAIAIAVSAGVAVFLNMKKEVVINYDGKQITVKTMRANVGDVLDQNGISVSKYDYVSPKLDTKLQRIKKNTVTIKRAVPIYVFVDGQEKQIMTYNDTVKEALASNSIQLNPLDKVENAGLQDKIVKDMKIDIVRVREELVKEQLPIPYEIENRENNHLDKGVEKTVVDGKNGVLEKSFKVVYEDNNLVSKEFIKDTVVSNPINKLIELGTVLNYRTSRGDVIRYKKVLNMRATAYTASYADTGKGPGDPGFGITYTGIRAQKGVIAVDPRVIPLGSRVYVEVMGRVTDYGNAVAADTGSAIKGNLIDLYFDSQKTVNNWGCKNVKVYILID
ncbi:MAG: ubiquitin-like domain-containing protein [Bacillota bacterium]|nr:ubiquitin-like domain-containing protein [Bacillota bacterium]